MTLQASTKAENIKSPKTSRRFDKSTNDKYKINNNLSTRDRLIKYLLPYIIQELEFKSSGKNLSENIINYFMINFDLDFSNIKIHIDPESTKYAKIFGADAFTIGNDIFFNEGKYNPENSRGFTLLSHELVHSTQNIQKHFNMQTNINNNLTISSHYDIHEQEATRLSTMINNDLYLEKENIKPLPQQKGIISRQISAMVFENELNLKSNEMVRFLIDSLRRGFIEDPYGSPERVTLVLNGLDKSVLKQVIQGLKSTMDLSQWEYFQEVFFSKLDLSELEISTEEEIVVTGPKHVTETMETKPEEAAVTEKPTVEEITPEAAAVTEKPTVEEIMPEAAAVTEKTTEVEAAAGETIELETKEAAVSPESDPAFQNVVKSVKSVAKKQGSLPKVDDEVSTIDAAAEGPENELESQAKDAQIKKMSLQTPEEFNRDAFKKALLAKIEEITPKTQEDADEFKDSGKASSITEWSDSLVSAEKEKAQSPIKNTSEEKPDLSIAKEKEVVPLSEPTIISINTDIGAENAVPKPKPDSDISLEHEISSLDDLSQGISDETMVKTGEPQFMDAVVTKNEAKASAQQVPLLYRQEEKSILSEAKNQSVQETVTNLDNVNQKREKSLNLTQKDKLDTKTKDEKERLKVSNDIESIYNKTQTLVETTLNELDEKVNKVFDEGAKKAADDFETWVDNQMEEYKDERYSGLGAALWITDKVAGLPDEVNQFYVVGREKYVKDMDKVIDRVADLVGLELSKVQKDIADGKKNVVEYVDSLPTELKKFGNEAADKIQSKFDNLKKTVDEKSNAVIDNLATKYVENLKKIDESIEKKKEANKGLIDKVKDAIVGAYEAFVALKNMLVNIITKGIEVIGKILKDPIGFVTNLISGVQAGFEGFVTNIATHLQKGLVDWLLGEMSAAGIQLPETFDAKGIFNLLLQILGISFIKIRNKIAKKVGEENVVKVEKMIEKGEKILGAAEEGLKIFNILKNEGLGGLWDYIKDKLENIKDIVVEQIQSWIEKEVIKAGIKWILSLFNPVAAFIKAVLAIVDIIKFFIERAAQIARLINSILDALSAIAEGNIALVAKKVEDALANSIPVLIGLLASLLSLGGLSSKIKDIITGVQNLVDVAIDWVIEKIVGIVKWIGKKVGIGKEEEEEEKLDDPQHKQRVEDGLIAIDNEEKQYLENGKITRDNADKVVHIVKSKHDIFKILTVIENKKENRWDYYYEASGGEIKKGEETAERTLLGGRLIIRKYNVNDNELREMLEQAHAWQANWKEFEDKIKELLIGKKIPQFEEMFDSEINRNVTYDAWIERNLTLLIPPIPALSKDPETQKEYKEKLQEREKKLAEAKHIAKHRRPELFREGSLSESGMLTEVNMVEVTLIRDFTSLEDTSKGEEIMRKGEQIWHSLRIVTELYQEYPNITFVYSIFTPNATTEEEQASITLLTQTIQSQIVSINAKIIWHQLQ